MPKNMSIPDRWWQKVERRGDDECWPWIASRDKDGYGRFQEPGPNGQIHTRAHIWIVRRLHGDIPAGHVVMHSCDNPGCVNPAHLSTGTPRENNDDKVSKGRHAVPWGNPLSRSQQTHCKRGHPLEGDNVWINPKRGHRRCKTCGNLIARRSHRRKHGLPGDGQPRPRKVVNGGEVTDVAC